jgi:WD40 repeat protein
MKNYCALILTTAFFLVPGTARAQAVDALGDPLPAGAIARLGTARLRHAPGGLVRVKISPDGKLIASASRPRNELCVWDAGSGKEVRRLSAEGQQYLTEFAFSTGSDMVAAVVYDASAPRVVVWDLSTGKQRRRWDWDSDDVIGVGFVDADRAVVAVMASGQARWLEIAGGKQLRQRDLTADWPETKGKTLSVTNVAFSANGRRLVAEMKQPGGPSFLRAWDLVDDKALWSRTGTSIPRYESRIAWSPDGKLLAYGEGPPANAALAVNRALYVTLHDADTGKDLNQLSVPRTMASPRCGLSFSPDSKTLLVHSDSSEVIFFEIPSGKQRLAIGLDAHHLSEISSVAFVADGKRLAVAAKDHIRLCDPTTLKPVVSLEGHQYPARHLAFAADGKTLLTSDGGAGWQPSLVLSWNTTDWQLAVRKDGLRSSREDHLLFATPSASRCVVWQHSGEVVVKDVPGGKKIYEFPDKAPAFQYPGGHFSEDGTFVVLKMFDGNDRQKPWFGRVFDIDRGKMLHRIDEANSLNCVASSADRSKVAWCADGGVTSLDVASGKAVNVGLKHDREARLGVPALALSADGHLIAFCHPEDGIAAVWDLRKNGMIRQFSGQAAPQQPGKGAILAFSPDGRLLAVGGMGRGKDVELWELSSGKLRKRLSGHVAMVTALAFSADGRWLASGSEDTTALVWDLWKLAN